METFTVKTLLEILDAAAGADESINDIGDVATADFEEIGYESLAILEAAGEIERSYGVELDEDDLFAASTPQEVVDLVNQSINAK